MVGSAPGRPRYAEEIARIRQAVIDSPGVSDRDLRQAAYDGRDLPSPLGPYLAKVRDDAPAITDADLEELRAAGYTEDAILELTLATAAGAAGRVYDAAVRALAAEA